MGSPSNEEWQQTKRNVPERNAEMFNNPNMSDILITCGETAEFYAHKHVLGMSSSVFHSMFFGESAEEGSSIDIPSVDKESLNEFLHFLYSDKWSRPQTELTLNIILEVMNLADKYKIPALMDKCIKEVRRPQFFNPDNAFTILETSLGFYEKGSTGPFQSLSNSCWEKVDANTKVAIKSEGFVKIMRTTLCLFLQRDELKIEEIQLCDAVLEWAHRQCENHGIEATDENLQLVVGDAKYQLRIGKVSEQEIEESGLVKLMTTDEREAVRETGDGSTLQIWSSAGKRFHLIRVTRFHACEFRRPRVNWKKTKVHTLKFMVDKTVLFHGVRLFGTKDQDPREYKVTLKFNGETVVNKRKCQSVVTGPDGLNGFDVLLDEERLAKETSRGSNTIEAIITGPKAQYGVSGERMVEEEGFQVTFRDCTSQENKPGRQGSSREKSTSIRQGSSREKSTSIRKGSTKENKTNKKKGQFHQIFLSCS